MLRGVVCLIVHAENQGGIRISSRRGDNHFFHGAANMFAGARAVGKQPGGFHHDGRAYRRPVQLTGILHAKHLEALAVHGDGIVLVSNFVRQITEDRIVLQQVCQRFGVGDVVDGHDFDGRIAQRRAKDVAADASETIDTYFNCHESSGDCSRAPSRTASVKHFNQSRNARGWREKSQRTVNRIPSREPLYRQ